MSKNQRGEAHPNWKGGPVEIKCAYCGEMFFRKRACVRKGRNFCNIGCEGKWRSENLRGAVIYNYKGGIKAARERRKGDIKERLNARMRTMIRLSLRGNKNGYSWESLAGYSSDDLRNHLQKTMPHGMTWADFMTGDLEIDHIIPQAAFNITSASDIDFKKCWALKNLQFLPAKKNRQKGARIQVPFQPSLAMQVAL
jgi:5-methylcytosine-specific restriction endonuclease McrA